MMIKSFERKWVVIAVAAYLFIMVDLLPSPIIASLLPVQQLPGIPGGSDGGKTASPRKALGGRFKLKGATSLDAHIDFGKNKEGRAVESRSLRETSTSSPPSPLRNQRKSQDVHAPPPPLI